MARATDEELLSFAEDFQQQVIADSDIEDEESFREDEFTEHFIANLMDAGEIEDGLPAYHKARGVQLNGYGVSAAQDTLYMFASLPKWGLPPLAIYRNEIDTAFRRLATFFQKSVEGYHFSLEEASPAFDAAELIYRLHDSLTSLRLYVFTDGVANVEFTGDAQLDGVNLTYDIWDIQRLFRLWSSGRQREPIHVDFSAFNDGPIPCLMSPRPNDVYTSYVAILPGELLFSVYEKYGPRLLEKNVRTFLQLRSKVNKDMRSTILYEPHMFLAYNNGISVTAEQLTTEKLSGGGIGISSAIDVQIVNGAQTVASLFHAKAKDKKPLEQIFVQAKITVLDSVDKMDEVVPRISEYSNSQNKISMADFSANHPFHRAVEELSRTIWAPAPEGSTRQSRWFYERARGQYLDQKGRELTPGKKKAFETTHPKRQYFTKTDLAKFENTWDQLPHYVSLGAQKNFQHFMLRLQERGGFKPGEDYFRHLVGKAILFREAERLVQARKYGGYRAQIVAYSLAWLSHASQMRIDFGAIWKRQALSPALCEAIETVSYYAHKHITNPPGGRNITEWCKKEQCWAEFKEMEIELSEDFHDELIALGLRGSKPTGTGINTPDPEDMENIRKVMSIPAQTWLSLANWAKETDNLPGWQRKIVFSVGKHRVQKGIDPSPKQALWAMNAFQEAIRLGFDPQVSS